VPIPEPTTTAEVAFATFTPDELSAVPAGLDWVWEGYLAAGQVTLLVGLWKGGKTTLISVLIARMAGGGTVGGRAVRAGRVLVVSEEDQRLWAMRGRQLGLGQHARFMCRPFRGRQPTPEDWRLLVDHVLALRDSEGLDLVVVDSLTAFLPGRSSSDAGGIADLFIALRRLTAAGVSVLVLHHPRRGSSAAGESARGGAAAREFVDILVEMSRLTSPLSDDRRRKLTGFSPYPQTPRRLVIELSPDGTDYTAVGDVGDAAADLDDGWPLLLRVLEEAGQPLTRQEILTGWPPDHRRPNAATVWRWLERAVADGRVRREGTGRPRDPFRYGVGGGEERDGDFT
jgi:RecA-family ATPase